MHIGKSKRFPVTALKFDGADVFNFDITLAKFIAMGLHCFYATGCPAIALTKERRELEDKLYSKPSSNWTEDDWKLSSRIELWDNYVKFFKKEDHELFRAMIDYLEKWFKDYADDETDFPIRKKDEPEGLEMFTEIFPSLWS